MITSNLEKLTYYKSMKSEWFDFEMSNIHTSRQDLETSKYYFWNNVRSILDTFSNFE